MKGRELYHFKLCEAEEAYNETNGLTKNFRELLMEESYISVLMNVLSYLKAKPNKS